MIKNTIKSLWYFTLGSQLMKAQRSRNAFVQPVMYYLIFGRLCTYCSCFIGNYVLKKLIIFRVFEGKWPEENINDKDIHQTLPGAEVCCDWGFNTFQKPAALDSFVITYSLIYFLSVFMLEGWYVILKEMKEKSEL